MTHPPIVRTGSWRLKVVLVLVGLVGGLVLGEVVLRVLDTDGDYFLISDPLVGWRHRPGDSGWRYELGPRHEYRAPVQINTNGLRDNETPYETPPNTHRILLLGDSITAALQVPLEATFSETLERNLNAAGGGRRYEVINGGVDGYGTSNQLLSYRHELHRYRAPVVVLVFWAQNDFDDNLVNLSGRVTIGGGPVARLRIEGETVTEAFEQPTSMIGPVFRLAAETTRRHSMLARFLGTVRRVTPNAGGPVRIDATRTAPAGPTSGRLPDASGPARPESTVSDARLGRAYANTRALILALDDEVRAHGARLAIVSPPAGTTSSIGTQAADPDRFLAAVAAERDLPFAALGPDFLAFAAHSSEPLYFKRDGHLTPAGHVVMANALHRWLTTWSLL